RSGPAPSLIKYVDKKAIATLEGLIMLIIDACCYLAQQIAVLLPRYQAARAVRLEQRRKAASEQE
ncbi:hypothetical protein, partial [Burkholderia sp. A2]|uniref:hypothetical protein n=1 Tax=Burkholderia sp. A2 TaxID=236253 RepID=UPI001C401ABE